MTEPKHGKIPLAKLRIILHVTAGAFGVPVGTLTCASKERDLSQARGVGMYLSRELTGASLSRIGKFYGGRDTSTVAYQCRCTKARVERDPEFAVMVREIEELVANASTTRDAREQRIDQLEARIAELESFVDRMTVRHGIVCMRGTQPTAIQAAQKAVDPQPVPAERASATHGPVVGQLREGEAA